MILLLSYFIAIKENQGDVLNTLHEYKPLYPPQGRFYADPFLFKHEGTNYIFFENYDYKKGVISYVTLDPLSEPKPALELSTHLSFPSLFQEEGQIYMVPETYRHQSVSLFKATHFPDQWERQRILIRGDYFSDPILFKHDGYYWLFTATNKDILTIHYAKNLHSTFKPHPINRTKKRGRNAGGIYSIEGKLIRPTMDCSIYYGRSMILKEILLLTPTEFEERDMAFIEPNWAPHLKGTHTFSQSEDYVVYDGCVK